MTSSSSFPPISSSFLNSIPLTIVTIDDINPPSLLNTSTSSSNPSNSSNSPSNSNSSSFLSSSSSYNPSECIICLDQFEIGKIYYKLDCGHIFHSNCLNEWLLKQCTCPQCRYEYPTDNKEFEIERKKRMKNRRLRLRKDELNKKTIKQLRDIFEIYQLDTKNCFEKSELIEKLINSGYIDLQRRAPPLEIEWNELKNKSVSDLKKMMLAFGISTATLLEKDDLLEALKNSGRLKIINTEEDNDFLSTTKNSSLYSYSGTAILGDETTYPIPLNSYQYNESTSKPTPTTSSPSSPSSSSSSSNTRSSSQSPNTNTNTNTNNNRSNNNNNNNNRRSRNGSCVIT